MNKILIVFALYFLAGLSPVEAQSQTSGRDQVYQATHTKTTELKHTALRVKFDFEKQEMEGEALITASPYFYPSDSLVLNAKAMLIHKVSLVESGKRSDLKYTYNRDLLHINLAKKYQRGQEYTVEIKYTARPNFVAQKGSAAISDAKGLYFINPKGEEKGKPTQIWTQGETESSSAWFPTIDKPNQKTTQEIYMTVPDKYVTLSNGRLESSSKVGDNLRTDHWVMDKIHAPYLFFMGVGDYAVIKDKWRNIPVDYYVEREYEPFAKQIFGNTPEMIEFFSKILNYDYPWNKYAQMTARDYVSGAMENTTAVLHSSDAQQNAEALADENSWEDVISHELFHHWFGDLVTTESWSNLSVNESFANYSEYLWNEHKYGKDMADYGLMKALASYFADPSLSTKDLIRFNYHNREDMFDAVSYNKGGAVLHMLRNYLGDDAFFSGLNNYLKTNEYKTGEAHQVRLAFEEISGKDLNWFFNQWYFGSGHPKLSYTTRYEPVKKQVIISIVQSQTGKYFEFPLAIDLFDGSSVSRKNVWVNAQAKNDFTFSSERNPELITINSDGVIVAELVDNKSQEQNYKQYLGSKDFLMRYQAVEKAATNNADPFAIKTLVKALEDSNFRIRIAALNGLDLKKSEHLKQSLAKVEKMAEVDEKTLVKGAALNALGKTANSKYAPLYEKSAKVISNSVQANAIGALGIINKPRAIELLKEVKLQGLKDEDVQNILPLIVESKIEKHMPTIAQSVAFYPFLKFQDPVKGDIAQRGFDWIMSSDSYEATQKITSILGIVKGQLGSNPQAKAMILQILREGREKKTQLLRKDPTSSSVNSQIKLLSDLIDSYQK